MQQDQNLHTLKQSFHPLIAGWFAERFERPTEVQERSWQALHGKGSVLLTAPTGSGKTMAAFLTSIDRLLQKSLRGELAPQCEVLYISPLRALSHDIAINLQGPLAEISQRAEQAGLGAQKIEVALRTGDTTASERARINKKPPHILVTTPESLYVMLTSVSGRQVLKMVKTVIIDEIHAIARDKRGAHLSLSLERLETLVDKAEGLQRIGLSATQRPLQRIAAYMMGQDIQGTPRTCEVIDCRASRDQQIFISVPETDLSAICSHQQWQQIYQQIVNVIETHKSTLIFVNTRRLAERLSYQLGEMLGEDQIACHHGSMSKKQRHQSEQRLKEGSLKAVVATASLELGIDIGSLDVICQIGSPRSINVFLQRLGRSGHSVGAQSRAYIFPLSRDELLECMALMAAIQEHQLDESIIIDAPLDLIYQQVVAEVAAQNQHPELLYQSMRRSYVFADLSREDFEQILLQLSEGISERSQAGRYIFYDRQKPELRPRKHARLVATTCGGAIPDLAEYRVVTEEGTTVGQVDEEFAVESAVGDVFLLGSSSWRVRGLRGSQLLVDHAEGAPPSIPFWKGEAWGRSDALSEMVGRLRQKLADALDNGAAPSFFDLSSEERMERVQRAAQHCALELGIEVRAAQQGMMYVAAQLLATKMVPSHRRILFERFFDESGGMQMVIHAPFGSRINRAWGLAMRKRYCRSFDFELQAAANEDSFGLSLSPHDGFDLKAMFHMVKTEQAPALLEQAILQTPLFGLRWRWNVTRSLAVRRMNGGKKVPPHLQRYRSDDLLAAVFPQQTQCFEHITGDIAIPEHPLVQQTMKDCLQEALDLKGLLRVLKDIEGGEIELQALDTREPSPFAHELIHANPYAFLDDAPLEERRTRAVSTRRFLTLDHYDDLSVLDQQILQGCCQQVAVQARDADEMHDLLQYHLLWPCLPSDPHLHWIEALITEGRARRIEAPDHGYDFFVSEDRWPDLQGLLRWMRLVPPEEQSTQSEEVQPLILQLLLSYLEVMGPRSSQEVADFWGLASEQVDPHLEILRSQGRIHKGRYRQHVEEDQWCDSVLLARVHRLSVQSARQKVKPVTLGQYLHKQCLRHGFFALASERQNFDLNQTLMRLQGYPLTASLIESEILSPRLSGDVSSQLDQLSLSGQFIYLVMGRSDAPQTPERATAKLKRNCRVIFVRRSDAGFVIPTLLQRRRDSSAMSELARSVYQSLEISGPQFYDDLLQSIRVPEAMLQEGLGELMAMGLLSCDSFEGLRYLLGIKANTGLVDRPRLRPNGRWYLVPKIEAPDQQPHLEWWARLLLERYGVLCRDHLEAEPLAPRWMHLVRVLRLMEARGIVRGGCFVEGLAGEQFAMPESITGLRQMDEAWKQKKWVVLHRRDPLMLKFCERLLSKELIGSDAAKASCFVLRQGSLVARGHGTSYQADPQVDPSLQSLMHRALRLNGYIRRMDPFLH